MDIKNYLNSFNLENHYDVDLLLKCVYFYCSVGVSIDLVRISGRKGLYLYIFNKRNYNFLFEWKYTEKDLLEIFSEHGFFMHSNRFDIINGSNRHTDENSWKILTSIMEFMNMDKETYGLKYNLK
jgi:hypothetical protein